MNIINIMNTINIAHHLLSIIIYYLLPIAYCPLVAISVGPSLAYSLHAFWHFGQGRLKTFQRWTSGQGRYIYIHIYTHVYTYIYIDIYAQGT